MDVPNRAASSPTARDPFSRDTLEFASIVAMVRGCLLGPLAHPLVDALAPRAEIASVRRDLALAGEAMEYLRVGARPRLGSLKDPRPIFEKFSVEGVSCTAFEILTLVDLARAANEHRGFATNSAFTHLGLLAGRLPDLRDLVRELDGKILPDGSVDSSASAELGRIRRSIERVRREIQSTLERLVRRFASEQVLQDAVVTIRNDRFVIPVRADDKRRVAGVVHGTSSSGATVYVEPLETLPLNNELVELEEREFAEVQRILAEFTAKLRARHAELASATEILSELDFAFAKAEFARQYDASLPEFSNDGSLRLEKARHPLLEKALRARGRKSVPLTLELAPPKNLLVISGPNTGGKTITLKTVGVAALMAQAGLPVAATSARLPLFHHVLADIGDLQSIEASLSTFSAHITNIQGMVEVAGARDLVLLDEIGASTDPKEGAALAVAILEYFRVRGAMTFVTTHQSRLKSYAAETPAAENAAMEFDESTLEPTYRLLVGLPGKSSGLDTAARLGLEPSIVAAARSLIDPADAEAAALVAKLHDERARLEQDLASAERARRELAEREAALEREFETQRRKRLQDLDKRLDATLREHEKRWQAALDEIRVSAQAAKLPRRAERQAAALAGETRAEWNSQVLEALGVATPEEPSRPAAAGDTVRVASLPTPGRVLSVQSNGTIEVEVGRMRMRVPANEVQVVVTSAAPEPSRLAAEGSRARAVAVSGVAREAEPPAEINVIGTTAEEAREQVDKFLDDAVVAGRFRLRVVHGHGKGILRRTLHEMFASHPQVEKFYAAPPHEGGTGATIVELKL